MAAPSEPRPPRRSTFQTTVMFIGAVSALLAIGGFVANACRGGVLAEELKPHLTMLQSANTSLTGALNELGTEGWVEISRSRRELALDKTRELRTFMQSAEVDGEQEQEIERDVHAVVIAEVSYLRAVRAFLDREPSLAQKQQLRNLSETLRNQLVDLGARAGVVTPEAVGGAIVLSAWFAGQKGGDSVAIKTFAPQQRSAARDRVKENAETPQCGNHRDDDGDGKVDYDPDGTGDPHCQNARDDDESGPETVKTQCANGGDDDGDGKADFGFDPGCADAADNDETDPPVEPDETEPPIEPDETVPPIEPNCTETPEAEGCTGTPDEREVTPPTELQP
ncbi:hypothetical protein OJ997_06620 [Solirubrobacter phytolaccae]|uniref:DUF5667 domain-containing protein n=1 Tax=Solirubrobacter phytolaccae TaxID=1404360 RepID=A0A9X3S869_9ACTN|nr:hypothetical protein [Solirubrobacter phytolaccae]MDA0179961.1 hypothetical protein [Solirubrobacter phytolaccae]